MKRSRWIQKIIRLCQKIYIHRLKSLKLELLGQKRAFEGFWHALPSCPAKSNFHFICKLPCICSSIRIVNSFKIPLKWLNPYFLHEAFPDSPFCHLNMSFFEAWLLYTFLLYSKLCLTFVYISIISTTLKASGG